MAAAPSLPPAPSRSGSSAEARRHPVPAALLAGAATFVTFAAIEAADRFHGVQASSGANEPGRDGGAIVVLLLAGLVLGLAVVGFAVGAVVDGVLPRRLPALVAELLAVVGVVAVVIGLVSVGGGSYGHWSPEYVAPRTAIAGIVAALAWIPGRLLLRPAR